MRFKVYEYEIKGNENYKGHYTLKADCSKEQDLKVEFKSKLVQEFDY